MNEQKLWQDGTAELNMQAIAHQIAALKQAQKEARKQERINARLAANALIAQQIREKYETVIDSLKDVGLTEKDFLKYVRDKAKTK